MPHREPLPGANTLAEIAERFLQRTGDEIQRLRTLVQSAGVSVETLQALEQATHRIGGTSDLLGFTSLADAAGEVENLCLATDSRAVTRDELLFALETMAEETARALAKRG